MDSGFRRMTPSVGESSQAGSALILHLGPAAVGVVVLDGGGADFGLLAEVLLIDPAVLIDDKRHDAGIAVVRRPGDHREPAYHVPVDHVVVAPAGGILPLSGDDPVVVAH